MVKAHPHNVISCTQFLSNSLNSSFYAEDELNRDF